MSFVQNLVQGTGIEKMDIRDFFLDTRNFSRKLVGGWESVGVNVMTT